MAGGAVEHSLEYGGAVGLGSVSAQKLWKNTAEESEPRPLQIEYNSGMSIEDSEICEDLGLPGHQKVAETVFEDPEEANIRPRLLVPLQSVLGLKALCEREYIRTETVTEMLNQCRTAYYKELLYLREQLILAAEPEKQMLLASVQNYEVYYFNPPAYVDEDLKEYMMNCSRWTHKKLIEENYELQMKLAGQEDVFENADFCLKGLLRRHGTYRMFKTMHNIVRNAKDLFNPEDMIRKKETEGLKPIDELQAAVIEVFPNLKAKEDNSAILLAEIEELQKSVTDLRAELAKVKDLLEKERSRADDLSRQCEEHMKNKPAAAQVEVVKEVDNEATLEELRQMKDLKQRLEQEAQAQARRLHKQVEEFAAAKSLQPGHASADPSKLVPKLDEAILEAEQLLQAAASLTSQVTVSKVQATTKQVVDRSAEEKALKEVQQLKQQLEVLTAKLAAAEKREQDALQKLKELQNKKPEKVERPESAGPAVPGDYDELKDRLERKLARIAELEADLDQAKRDLRAANRKVEEQELLLQERARKDAEKAKQMSDLMEKLRKSEEEAENLAGKLYKAQEKIKKLKEEIRELKNKLGIAVQESEEEEEEEVDNSPHFMSRYYLRAKNSGKPRWMLLSEDAKLKSQRTEHMQQQAHHSVSSNFQAANALQFLRRAPSSESQKPRGVRLQYGDTQEWYPPEMGMGMGGFGDGTPHAPHAGGFSRQSSFQMGHTFTDGSAASPGGRRLMTSGSTTFSPGDASPQQFHSFSRQGTASMAGFGRNQAGSPLMAGGNSRQSTPTGSALVHPMLGMPQGLPQGPLQGLPQGLPQGLAQGLPQGMSFSGSRAAAPAGTGSWQVSGPGMSTSGLSYRPGLAPSGSYSSYHIVGQRQGTPPTGVAELLGGPRVAASFSPTSAGAGEIAASARSNMQGTVIQGTATSTHASSVLPPQDGGNSTGLSSVAAMPLRLPPGAADENRSATSSAASSDNRHPDFRHSNSASMSPSSCRLRHVGLASPGAGGASPYDAPLLELVPQDSRQDFSASQAMSPSRRGQVPLQPLRQNSSSVLPMQHGHRMEAGDASLALPDDAFVPRRVLMEPGSQSVPVWRKQDLPSEGSTRATDPSPTPSRESSQVPRPPLQKAPTSPLIPSSGMSGAQAERGLTTSKTTSAFRQVDVDLAPVGRVQTSPVTGASGLDASQKVMSWAGQNRPSAPKPLTNGALVQGRGRLPPPRSFSTSTLESNVEYVQADALPRLPAGKVKKAAPTPSWMSSIF